VYVCVRGCKRKNVFDGTLGSWDNEVEIIETHYLSTVVQASVCMFKLACACEEKHSQHVSFSQHAPIVFSGTLYCQTTAQCPRKL